MESQNGTGLKKIAEACWAQARADYAAAVTLLDAGVYFAAAFFAQQSAEMILKAATTEHYKKIPRGHNLVAMAAGLNAPEEILEAAIDLNPLFLCTRSPEAIDGVPAQHYEPDTARQSIRNAQRIVDWVKSRT